MRAFLISCALLLGVGCEKQRPPTEQVTPPEDTPAPNPKGPDSAPTSRTPVAKVSAIDLFNEYGQNVLAADKKYKGKIVEVNGWGKIGRSDAGRYRYTLGFEVITFPGMTQSQLSRLPPREQKWFREGSYPPNVIAYLNSEGEAVAADYKTGDPIRAIGIVRGTKKADVWRDHVLELEDCTLQPIEKPPAKSEPTAKDNK
ncbi:: tRNA_anti-like [Gemmata massiliana]|uniref:: tRNA_anti-like n=1 Tax=Gemmata massiliana TaxID=1210884 RepID=A0A6P2DD81_9BACT|nr:hypothetical protein [Gemmata massiliana]VTR98861.1 : tRNA_anti-like [Gemmata massiliana]